MRSLLGNGGLAIAIAYLAAVGRPGPRRRFFAAWAAAIAILLAGVNGAGRLAARQKGEPQLDYDLDVPLAGVTGPSTDLDGFLGAVGADFATADRKAQEERRRFKPAPDASRRHQRAFKPGESTRQGGIAACWLREPAAKSACQTRRLPRAERGVSPAGVHISRFAHSTLVYVMPAPAPNALRTGPAGSPQNRRAAGQSWAANR